MSLYQVVEYDADRHELRRTKPTDQFRARRDAQKRQTTLRGKRGISQVRLITVVTVGDNEVVQRYDV